MTLQGIGPRSKLGGVITKRGSNVTYTPPAVQSAQTFDYVSYVVRDATGKTARGVCMFRVSP